MSMYGPKVSDKQFAYAIEGHGIKAQLGEYKNHTLTLGNSAINLRKIARTTIPAMDKHLWTQVAQSVAWNNEPKAARLALANMQIGAENLLKTLAVSARELDANTVLGKTMTIADAFRTFSEKAPQDEDGRVKVLVRTVDENNFSPKQLLESDNLYLQAKPMQGKFGVTFEQMDLPDGKKTIKFRTLDGADGIAQQKTLRLPNVLTEVLKSEVGTMSDEALTSAMTLFVSPEMDLLMDSLENTGKDQSGKDAALAWKILTAARDQIMEAHATRMHNKAKKLALEDQHALARELVQKVDAAEDGRPEEAARVAAAREKQVVQDEEAPLMEKFDAAARDMALPTTIKQHCKTLLLQFYLSSRPRLLEAMQQEHGTEPVDKAANDTYVKGSILDTVVKDFIQELGTDASPAEIQLGMYVGCVDDLSVRFLSDVDFKDYFEKYATTHFGPWAEFLGKCASGLMATESHTRRHALDFQSLPADADISNPVEKVMVAVLKEARDDLKKLSLQDIEKKYGTALSTPGELLNFAMHKAGLAIIKDAWNSVLRPLDNVRCTRAAQDALLNRVYDSMQQGGTLSDEQIRGAWSIAENLSYYLRSHSDSDSKDAAGTVKNMLQSFTAEQNRVLQLLSSDASTRERIRMLAFNMAIDLLKKTDGLTSSESSPKELLEAAGGDKVESFWEDPSSLGKLLLEETPVPFSTEEVQKALEEVNAQITECGSRQSEALERKKNAEQTIESTRTLVSSLEQEMRGLEKEKKDLDSRIATVRAGQISLSDKAERLRRELPLRFAELGKTYAHALKAARSTLHDSLKPLQPTIAPNLRSAINVLKNKLKTPNITAKSQKSINEHIAKHEKTIETYTTNVKMFNKKHPTLAALSVWDDKFRKFGDIETEEDMRLNAMLLQYAEELRAKPDVIRTLRDVNALLNTATESAALQEEAAALEQQALTNTLRQSEGGIKLRDAQQRLDASNSEQTARLNAAQKDMDKARADSSSALGIKQMLERQQQKLSTAGAHAPDKNASSWQRIEARIRQQLDLPDEASASNLYDYLTTLGASTSPRVEHDPAKAQKAVMRDNIQLLKSEISVKSLESAAKIMHVNLEALAVQSLEKDEKFKHGADLLRGFGNGVLGRAFNTELQQLLADVRNKELSLEAWKNKYGAVFSESQLLDGALARAAHSVLGKILKPIREHTQNTLAPDQYTAKTVFTILHTLGQNKNMLPPDMGEKNCLFLLYAHTQLKTMWEKIQKENDPEVFGTLLYLGPVMEKMHTYLEQLFPAGSSPKRALINKVTLWQKAGELLKAVLPEDLKRVLSSDAVKDFRRHLECMGSFRVDGKGMIIRPDRSDAESLAKAAPVSERLEESYQLVKDVLNFTGAFTGADDTFYNYPPSMVPHEPLEVMKSLMPEFARGVDTLRAAELPPHKFPADNQEKLVGIVQKALDDFKTLEQTRGTSVKDAPSMALARTLLDALGMINIAESMGAKVNSDIVIRILAGIGRPQEQVKQEIMAAYSLASPELKACIEECIKHSFEDMVPEALTTVEERIILAAQSISKRFIVDERGHVSSPITYYRDFLLPPDGNPTALRQLRGEMEHLWQETSASYLMQQAYRDLQKQLSSSEKLPFEMFEQEVLAYMPDSVPEGKEQHTALRGKLASLLGEKSTALQTVLNSIAEAKRKHVEWMAQHVQTGDTLSHLAEHMNATPNAYTALRSLLERLIQGRIGSGAERVENFFSPSNAANIQSNRERLDEHLERFGKHYARAREILTQGPRGQQLLEDLQTHMVHIIDTYTQPSNMAQPLVDDLSKHRKTIDHLIKMRRDLHELNRPDLLPRLATQVDALGALLNQTKKSDYKDNAYVFEEKAQRILENIQGMLPQLYVGADPGPTGTLATACWGFMTTYMENRFGIKTVEDVAALANGPDSTLKDQLVKVLPDYLTLDDLRTQADTLFPKLAKLEKM